MASHVAAVAFDRRLVAHKLSAAGWGAFFLWIGIALLTNLSWGVGILGVGVLVLGEQVARKCMALKLETFWTVVGVLFILGGIWGLFNVRVSLVAILCIVAGAVLLLSALLSKPQT